MSKMVVSTVSTHTPALVGNQCTEKSIDGILEKTPLFSRFQIIFQISAFYLDLVVCYHIVLSFFTGNDPAWRCVSNSTSYFCRLHMNESISSDNDAFKERCNLNRSEWEYTTAKTYSFVTEFDLVCDKAPVAAFISASYYIGGTISAAAIGAISDIYGRKPVLLLSMILVISSSLGSSFVTDIWQLCTLNVLRGGASAGAYYIVVIYHSEFSPPRWRPVLTSLLLLFGSSSYLYLDFIAYFVRQWRNLSTYAVLPTVPAIVVFSFLPESPRWLLATGKQHRADIIMGNISKFNVSSNVIRLELPRSTRDKRYTYLDLVRNFTVFKLVSTLVTIWLIVPVTYYTIALQTSFGGNIYSVFALSTIVDIPGYLISAYLCNSIGRKRSILGGLILSGTTLIALTLVPRHVSHRYIINITMALLAKFAIVISFSGIFTWTSELFPTVVRSQGLCICAIFDRVGCIAVPFISRLLQSISHILPFILVGVMAIFASIIGSSLPETKGKPTRETYADFFQSEPSEVDGGFSNTIGQDLGEENV